MPAPPLVSILIANFNNGRFIVEALESAVKQTYPNTEIVIVDDGSEDESISVIDGFINTHPEKKVRLVKNNDHKGCGRIKRQCVELSQGEYFCFLDPDDTIVPEAVAILMEVVKTHPEYGIVYCTHYLCNENLEPQGVSTYPGRIPEGQSHLTSTEGHISALALCNRKMYDQTPGIDTSYQVAEDQDLYLKMEEVAPVFFVDKPLYYYRKHDHNTSWDDNRIFNNFYWKYFCVKAAYLRRKRGISIDNLSRLEMNSLSFSFYLRLGKERWKQHRFVSACCAYLRTIPFVYTQIIKQH